MFSLDDPLLGCLDLGKLPSLPVIHFVWRGLRGEFVAVRRADDLVFCGCSQGADIAAVCFVDVTRSKPQDGLNLISGSRSPSAKEGDKS